MTRIAMWCAPRTISTALMRAWENRPDTVVIDEPFYAHYLQATGMDHPGRDDIIVSYEADWRIVARTLTEDPLPEGAAIWYQKQMAHHILDHIELDWVGKVTNCFLIRAPAEVITSYIKVRAQPALLDLGFPQLLRLFETVRRDTGSIPPIIDSQGCAGESPRHAHPAVRSGVGAVLRADALLAAGSPRQRRRLGALLVRSCGKIDRFRPLPSQRRSATAAFTGPLGPGAGDLPGTIQIPPDYSGSWSVISAGQRASLCWAMGF